MSKIVPLFPELIGIYLPSSIAEKILNSAADEKEVVELTTNVLHCVANKAFNSDVQELINRVQEQIIEDDEFE